MKTTSCFFHTNRLLVRPLCREDYQTWKGAIAATSEPQNEFDSYNKRFVSTTFDNFLKTLANDKKQLDQGITVNLYAFSEKSDELIGGGQYWLIQRGHCQRATIGYWILNNQWKRGFGFELAQGMIAHGLKKLKLNRLEAEILITNSPSIKLCDKLGMIAEGVRRQSLFENGKWRDHLVYAVTASDLGIVDRPPDITFKSIV